jgi:hypothetical protein
MPHIKAQTLDLICCYLHFAGVDLNAFWQSSATDSVAACKFLRGDRLQSLKDGSIEHSWSVTLGASQSTYAHDGRNADIDLLLWPALFTFYYVGFSPLPPFITYGVDVGTPWELGVSIENFRGCLKSLDSTDAVPFNRIDEWDSDGRLRLGTPVFSPFIRRRRHLDLE